MFDTIIGTAEHVADTTLLSKANSQHTYRTERSRVEAQDSCGEETELYNRLGEISPKAQRERQRVNGKRCRNITQINASRCSQVYLRRQSRYTELLQLLENRQMEYRDCCSKEELLHSDLKLITDHEGNVLEEDFGIHSEVADQDYSASCRRIKKRCQLTSEEIVGFINRLSEAEKDDH